MNRSHVYHLLKTHYECTGTVLDAAALIQACGNTDAVQVLAGRRSFETYLKQDQKTTLCVN